MAVLLESPERVDMVDRGEGERGAEESSVVVVVVVVLLLPEAEEEMESLSAGFLIGCICTWVGFVGAGENRASAGLLPVLVALVGLAVVPLAAAVVEVVEGGEVTEGRELTGLSNTSSLNILPPCLSTSPTLFPLPFSFSLSFSPNAACAAPWPGCP